KLLSNSDALELLAKDKGILIKKGSKRPEVKAIQDALLAMKIDIGSSTSDEVFGKNTYNAIKQFQEKFVVKNTIHPEYKIGNPDGVVGKNTLLAIDEALNIGWRVSNHFWSIIFNEVGSIKNDNVYNQLVQVFDAKNELLIEVKGSSKPNPFKPKSPSIKGENAYPHVKSGSYLVEHGLHKRKPALVLNSNKYVPTTKTNPNYPEYGKNANYIHVHWGYSKTWKGSAGCMTIHPDDWKRFLSSIPNGKGEITIP
ncbi:peptidoglycan-binding domain-containing protein, partial [uncultured Photobacterium sp.]|uniref:peptidoglycan-binding domain-containing protein n=1 Tax=uncultured Photobacterium sp. TaxID=173973 RepID=UPI0026071405